MVLALPRGHALARRENASKGLALKALAAETLIVYRRRSGPGLYDAILRHATPQDLVLVLVRKRPGSCRP